jgi:hypothetical protein
MKRFALLAPLALFLMAESDPRLTVHTLVREDIFAGFLAHDMTRFERGEATLGQLDKERPDQRDLVRVWQGAAALYRSVLAYEAGNAPEGDRLYQMSESRYDEAVKLGPNNPGVWAVDGASRGLFADRLPADKRAAAWAKSYEFYQRMAAQQMAFADKMPAHIRGELLAGVAMSAQRTGHQEEYEKSLDKMIELMANTPYGRTAQTWKDRPELASKSSLMCKNCHDAGRLEPTKARLASTAGQ